MPSYCIHHVGINVRDMKRSEDFYALFGFRRVRTFHASGREFILLGNGSDYVELFPAEGPDTAGTTKPDPSMIGRCLRAMDVPPEAAIYVGDMVLDVETASRAGVRVVLVPGGSSDRAELAGTGATVLGSLRELPDLLPAIGNGSGTAR